MFERFPYLFWIIILLKRNVIIQQRHSLIRSSLWFLETETHFSSRSFLRDATFGHLSSTSMVHVPSIPTPEISFFQEAKINPDLWVLHVISPILKTKTKKLLPTVEIENILYISKDKFRLKPLKVYIYREREIHWLEG